MPARCSYKPCTYRIPLSLYCQQTQRLSEGTETSIPDTEEIKGEMGESAAYLKGHSEPMDGSAQILDPPLSLIHI